MFFHVILTMQCNLQCKYCFGEALEDFDADFPNMEIDYSLPRNMNYDVSMLASFCKQDPECVVSFYGGEPLLCIDKIRQIMDNIEAKYFLIQTNGLLLDVLEPEYVNRFHTILVSIDGDEALTDFYRGKGTFRKVINNLKLIKQNGFDGELIARMTVMEQTNIYMQVKWLVENDAFPFSSAHWQLNAGFWGNDFARRNFKNWSEESYNSGVRELARFWVNYMETKGVVLRFYPFLGIVNSILSGEKASLLRCGGGWINYAVQTDGYIVPCPTMWGMKDYYVGHISTAEPLKLKKVFLHKPCTECSIFNVCGGRCLYASITKRWNAEQYSNVCRTVNNLIQAVSERTPKIRKLIAEGKIALEDFEFLKYNGCEIIP